MSDRTKQLIVDEAITTFINELREAFKPGLVQGGLNLFDVKVDNIKNDLRALVRNEPQLAERVDEISLRLDYMKEITRNEVIDRLL